MFPAMMSVCTEGKSVLTPFKTGTESIKSSLQGLGNQDSPSVFHCWALVYLYQGSYGYNWE